MDTSVPNTKRTGVFRVSHTKQYFTRKKKSENKQVFSTALGCNVNCVLEMLSKHAYTNNVFAADMLSANTGKRTGA